MVLVVETTKLAPLLLELDELLEELDELDELLDELDELLELDVVTDVSPELLFELELLDVVEVLELDDELLELDELLVVATAVLWLATSPDVPPPQEAKQTVSTTLRRRGKKFMYTNTTHC